MAVTIGSVSAALVGFTASEQRGLPPDKPRYSPMICAGALLLKALLRLHTIRMLLLRRHQLEILFKRVLCAGSSGPITEKTTNLITVLLLPVAILMIAYALCTFYMRSVYLQRKQVGPCEFPLVLLRHAEDKVELHVLLMVAAWSKCHIYPANDAAFCPCEIL